jgi:hypothetical protein
MLYPISRFRGESPEQSVGFIDAGGMVRIEPRFAGAGYFCEGKASVLEDSGLSGFINCRGQIEIAPIFRGISHFNEGVCLVGTERAIGYIDHSGRWLIEPRFLIGMAFSEGRTFVSNDGESFQLIDMNGSTVTDQSYERARMSHAGLAPVMKDGVWGFLDRSGRVVIPFAFEDALAQHFLSGLAAVKVRSKWGFIYRFGDFVVKPYFDQVLLFSEGLAPVKLDEKWGVIDLAGRVRLQPRWDALGQFVGGLANATQAGKSGYISPTGSWAIEPTFDTARTFSGDLAVVKTGVIPAYIRVDGTVVWEFEPHAIVPRPPIPI